MEGRGLCRKIAFSRQDPKIVYWKINNLRVQTFLFSVICDRARYHPVCLAIDFARMLSYQEVPASIQVWQGQSQEAKIGRTSSS
jgi:hypothetical protein